MKDSSDTPMLFIMLNGTKADAGSDLTLIWFTDVIMSDRIMAGTG